MERNWRYFILNNKEPFPSRSVVAGSCAQKPIRRSKVRNIAIHLRNNNMVMLWAHRVREMLWYSRAWEGRIKQIKKLSFNIFLLSDGMQSVALLRRFSGWVQRAREMIHRSRTVFSIYLSLRISFDWWNEWIVDEVRCNYDFLFFKNLSSF